MFGLTFKRILLLTVLRIDSWRDDQSWNCHLNFSLCNFQTSDFLLCYKRYCESCFGDYPVRASMANSLVNPLNSYYMNCNSMSIRVFDTRTREKTKQKSICVDGLCFRVDRAPVQGFQKLFRCCDPGYRARVLFNSVTLSNSLRLARVVRLIINENTSRNEETCSIY